MLVASDLLLTHQVVACLAEAQPGLACEPVADAAGLERALAQPPAAVLAEAGLPWAEPVALAQALRSRLGHCPLLLLAAPEAEGEALASLEQGVDDYLLRSPDELRRLPSALRKCLAHARGRSARKAPDAARVRAAQAAARQGYEEFRALVEHSADLVLELDAGRRILYASPSVKPMLAHTPDELRGRDVLDFVAPEQREEVAAAFLRAASHPERGAEQAEHEVLHADGSRRAFESRGTAVRDAAGSLRFVVTCRDVTQRDRSERTLRASEQKFRDVSEQSPNMIFINSRGRVGYANVRCEEILGYSREELLAEGFDFRRLIAREYLPLVEENFRRHSRGEEVPPYEYALLAKDGRRIEGIHTTRLIDYEDGKAILGIVTDITERKRAEEQLRASEGRYRSLFDLAPLGIYLSRPDGEILAVNPKLAEILGYASAAELAQRRMQDLYVSPGDRESLIARFGPLGQASDYQLVWKRKDGTPVEIQLTAHALHDETGAVSSYEGFVRDISEQGRREREKQGLEQQLLQAQKMEAVGRLAGGVAHDFNNLLGVIVGYAELLLKRLPEEDGSRRRIEQILKAGERAAGLTRQLLAFSRRQVLQPRVLDLNASVSELERMLKRLIGEDVDLATVLDPSLVHVEADPGQIEQVLMNLAVNARDAMPEGGKLTIETRDVTLDDGYAGVHRPMRPGRYSMIAVTDTGTGIGSETLPHVFEPFFTTKEQGKGTGLGLSTVYGIVKQSGGYVWAYSEPGHGTTLKVYLPSVPAAEAPRADERPALPGGGSETVLAVEDEGMLREILAETLSGSGYSVLLAASGSEALRLAEVHPGPIHLLVTDVVMPGISGRALATRLAELRPGLRVLYMSGYTDDAIVRHGVLEAGVEFLGKPFSPDALLRRVRRVLDNR